VGFIPSVVGSITNGRLSELIMKRIFLGLVTIVGAVSVMYIGVTGAFFSDTESSLANLFTAGELDLLVDNESYYNGNRCIDLPDDNPDAGFVWDGPADFPVPGTSCDTSWLEDNLNDGAETLHKFFNFTDIKPDDEGEDTISLHVQNDAWMCMEVALTSNDDVDCTDPENAADAENGACTEPNQDAWDGELAQLIQMIWWADDGDNVLEAGEPILSDNVETLYNLATTTPFIVALADSQNNAWGENGPVPADDIHYVAKGWCFGTLVATPLAEGDTGPQDRGSGFSCDGAGIGNAAQTDSTTLDVSFSAVQSRNNPGFLCEGEQCTFDELVDLLVATAKFENPEVATTQNWDVFDSPADGWNVEWRDADPGLFNGDARPVVAHLELHEGVLGAAFEGDQYAELDTDWGGPTSGTSGEPASVSIYRDFATVPGADYILRYHFAPRPSTPAADNNLEVKIEGVALDTTGPTAGGGGPIAWAERSVPFTAGDASTEIRFTDLGTANSLGTFLDNVRLYQISCPVQ